MNKKIAVVALGGNALLRGNEVGTIQQQEKNTYNTCVNLISLLKDGYELVITHGNGPQVGNIMLRNEAGYKEYKIPVALLVQVQNTSCHNQSFTTTCSHVIKQMYWKHFVIDTFINKFLQ